MGFSVLPVLINQLKFSNSVMQSRSTLQSIANHLTTKLKQSLSCIVLAFMVSEVFAALCPAERRRQSKVQDTCWLGPLSQYLYPPCSTLLHDACSHRSGQFVETGAVRRVNECSHPSIQLLPLRAL